MTTKLAIITDFDFCVGPGWLILSLCFLDEDNNLWPHSIDINNKDQTPLATSLVIQNITDVMIKAGATDQGDMLNKQALLKIKNGQIQSWHVLAPTEV